MEIMVLNTNFQSIFVADRFKSLIWTDRYNAYGDFEMYFSMDSSLLQFIQPDNYLWMDESEHCMIIEDISIETDVEDGNHLKVTGRSLESILERRIIWGQKDLLGSLQDGIESLLNENIISPAIADRRIANFVFSESEDTVITGLTVDSQYTGTDLYSVIEKLCKKNNLGFKIVLNSDNQFVFSLYRGADRSYAQTNNPYVVFSPNFENIINSNYFVSKASYRNVTLVAGEGEGSARKTQVVGSGSGLDRRELFTDARDVSSNVDGGTLSNADYLAKLTSRGTENLEEYTEITAFEGEVEATRLFKYGTDFFIGDIIQIENEYGNTGEAYVSELITSQNETGIQRFPTFKTVQEEGEIEE